PVEWPSSTRSPTTVVRLGRISSSNSACQPWPRCWSAARSWCCACPLAAAKWWARGAEIGPRPRECVNLDDAAALVGDAADLVGDAASVAIAPPNPDEDDP